MAYLLFFILPSMACSYPAKNMVGSAINATGVQQMSKQSPIANGIGASRSMQHPQAGWSLKYARTYAPVRKMAGPRSEATGYTNKMRKRT